jgi:hypothetical protein
MYDIIESIPIHTSGISPLMDHRFLGSLSSSTIEPIYLTITDGTSRGYIAGLRIKPRYQLIRLSGLYRSLFFFTGPALSQGMDLHTSLGALTEYCKAKGYCSYTILPHDNPVDDELPLKDMNMYSREEFFIDVEGEPDLNRTTRKKRKRALRNGLEFDISSEHLDEFMDLLEQTRLSRENRGYKQFNKFWLPYVDERSMRSMLDTGVAIIMMVSKGEEILSANFVLVNDTKAYGISLGTSIAGYSSGANILIFTEAVEYLRTRGVSIFNIGGYSSREPSEGLVLFKKGLGAISRKCIGYRSPFLQGKILESISRLKRGISR